MAVPALAAEDAVPVIDSHIHLFDPTRPVFTGYMGSQEYRALNKPSLPGMYEPLARPAGVVGAIVVESSSWIDDNFWYLEVCRADPFMVGVCGSLDPARPDFGQYVKHFARDPLYRAIRSSRFYNEDGGNVTLKQDQVANLRAAGGRGPGAGYGESEYGVDAGECDAGGGDSEFADHHGPSAFVRSDAGGEAGVRGCGEGDGGPAEYCGEAVGGVSPAAV